MENPLIWAVLLLAIALALLFAELFVPSGGVISFFAACSLILGIVMLFKVDTKLGLVGAIVVLLATPFLFAAAIKIWPNTPIARLLLLKNAPSRGLQDQGVAGPRRDRDRPSDSWPGGESADRSTSGGNLPYRRSTDRVSGGRQLDSRGHPGTGHLGGRNAREGQGGGVG